MFWTFSDIFHSNTTCGLMYALGLLIVFYLFDNWLNKLKHFQKLNIPGPTAWPICGSLFAILSGRKSNYFEQYGRIFGYFLGSNPIVACTDPNLIKTILIKDFNLFNNRQFIDVVWVYPLDKMILFLKDDEWKTVRSVMTTTFTSGKLKQMTYKMLDIADTICEHIDRNIANGKLFDAKEIFGAYTVDIISSCCFGLRTDTIGEPHSDFVKYIKLIFPDDFFTSPKFYFFFLFPEFVSYMSRKNYVNMFPKEAADFFNSISKEIINKRRQNKDIKREDLIQILLDHNDSVMAGNGQKPTAAAANRHVLTDAQIISQAFVFYAGGYETTSSVLMFLAYNLALNIDCQERLYASVQAAFIDNNEKIDYDMINRIEYLDMVISETLRIYPPVVVGDRIASVDYKYNDFIFPKGSVLQFAIWELHHDPEFYPDPDRFDPERFCPKERSKRNNMTFLPFGTGPRNCLGMRFALVEIKILMCKLILKYEFETCKHTPIPLLLKKVSFLKPKKPIILKLKSRSS